MVLKFALHNDFFYIANMVVIHQTNCKKQNHLYLVLFGGIQSKEINGGAKNIDLENKNNHILL